MKYTNKVISKQFRHGFIFALALLLITALSEVKADNTAGTVQGNFLNTNNNQLYQNTTQDSRVWTTTNQNTYQNTDNRQTIQSNQAITTQVDQHLNNVGNTTLNKSFSDNVTNVQTGDIKLGSTEITNNGGQLSGGVNPVLNGGSIQSNNTASGGQGGQGGQGYSYSTSGDSKAASQANNAGVNNQISGGTYVSNYRNYTPAPNLGAIVGMIANNNKMCVYQNGGGASGSNGIFGGALNFMFGRDSDNCEALQRVDLLLALGNYEGACKMAYNFDKKKRDRIFVETIDSIGGCGVFKQKPEPAKSTLNVPPVGYWKQAAEKQSLQLDELYARRMRK